MKVLKMNIILISVLLSLYLPLQTWAENSIINERLIRLEEGQKRLEVGLINVNKRIDEGLKNVYKRIDEGLKNVNIRIDDMKTEINKRTDDLKDDIKELRSIVNFTLGGIITIIASISGLIAFIIWDRKTAITPIKKEQDEIKNKQIILIFHN